MPKNENENAVDAPVNYVPTAESISNASTASAAPTRKRRLGTGAIIGISAASVALLAGTFGAGAAVGATVAHNTRPGIGQMGEMAQQGQVGQGQKGQRDQMQQGQMGQDGQMQQGQRPQRQQGTPPTGAPTGAPNGGPQAMGPDATTGGSN